MKTVIALAALIAIASPAMAQQPAESVGEMVKALKGGGGGNNSPLKTTLGLKDKGGVASFVSGAPRNDGVGTGGWGNIGSDITGDKISKSPTR